MKVSTKLLLVSLLALLLYNGIVTYKLYYKVSPEYRSITVTIPGDTMYTHSISYYPKPYKVIKVDTIYDTIENKYNPSTLSQCKEDYKNLYNSYASTKLYKDTLKNDSSATVIIGASISNNKLDSLALDFKNNRKSQIVTNIYNVPKLSIGITGGYNDLTPYLEYNVNDKLGVLGGYNLTNKSLRIGVRYTIFNNESWQQKVKKRLLP